MNRELHMIGVARYMYEHAEDYGLPKDDMYLLGLLHDIGYLRGAENHEADGKKILHEFGFRSIRYGYAVEHHDSIPEGVSEETERVCRLLAEADMSVDVNGELVGYEKRLRGIRERHGKNSVRYGKAKEVVRWLNESRQANEKAD